MFFKFILEGDELGSKLKSAMNITLEVRKYVVVLIVTCPFGISRRCNIPMW